MSKLYRRIALVTLAMLASAPVSAQQLTKSEIEIDQAKANHVELGYLKLCADKNGVGCTLYGIMEMSGEGFVTRNEVEGVSYLRKGCGYGDAYGCRMLGVALKIGRGSPIDLPGARAAFELACSGKDANGCSRLGAMVNGGSGGPADPTRGASLVALACTMGDVKACAAATAK